MNYKYIFLSAALCALTASCSESLLDLSPETNNVLNNYYKNEEQINKGVNAAYACLQYSGQYGIANHVLGELPSDNTWDEVPANDGGNYGQLDEFNMTSSNTIIADSWKHNYIGIQQCNIILNRVDGVDMTENNRSVVKGEIKFLRALMYFNLVRIFGDVPLVTKETENVNDYFGQGRTNKSEVYQQIISDLKEATEMLPLTASLQGHATKGAAEGLLGKVYLTMGNYSEAKIELLKVVNSGQYALLDDPNDIFDTENEGNREIIFDVQYQSGLNGNSEGSNAFMMFSPSGSVSGAKGHNLPTREVYNLFADNDKRKTAYFRLTEVHGTGGHGKLLSGTVRDDTPPHARAGRHLLHLHGGEAHLVQPVLHGRRGVRRGEEGQYQDTAADAVEKRERTRHEDGDGGAGKRGERLHPETPAGQEHRTVVQHVL